MKIEVLAVPARDDLSSKCTTCKGGTWKKKKRKKKSYAAYRCEFKKANEILIDFNNYSQKCNFAGFEKRISWLEMED